jgi:RNA polymerase sigma-70 factor (ECF subfamily)
LQSGYNEQLAWQHPGTRTDMALLVTHLDAAYNLARWLMRNETDAEDLVQEAYLRAVSHFAGFRGGDGRAWLLTIVRNSCFDRVKQKGSRGQDTDFDEAVHSVGQQTSSAETLLILEERAGLVTESLAELPMEYREILVLRELEQLSYGEIANIAGIPLGTVMSRLGRARQRLQTSLLAKAEQEATGRASQSH